MPDAYNYVMNGCQAECFTTFQYCELPAGLSNSRPNSTTPY